MAREIGDFPVVDFHNDISGMPMGIKGTYDYRSPQRPPLGSILPEVDGGKVMVSTDIEGMRENNVKLVFAQIFPMDASPDGYKAPNNFLEAYNKHQAIHDRLLAHFPDTLTEVHSVESLEECLDTQKTGFVYGIEGMEGWDGDFSVLDTLWSRGVRSIGTNWNADNVIGTGCRTAEPHGLTSLGREFVRKANERGFLIDVSHASHQTAIDVLDEVKDHRVFASHTASRNLVDDTRNLDDAVALEIARRGGKIGVTFLAWMVGGKSVEHVVRHFSHYKNLFGKEGIDDALVLGTDFNGMAAATSIIPGLGTVAEFGPHLSHGLHKAGFSQLEIGDIFGWNGIQYLKQTLPKTS